ncbi:MAG: FapA family protein [bacterium]|nr:FapA family protein [bacterium]
MIKRFKLYADKGKLNLALIEYGKDIVTLEQITEALALCEIEEFDKDAVIKALGEGVETTLVVSETEPFRLSGAAWITIDELNNCAKVNLYSPINNGKLISESDILDELGIAGCGNYYTYRDVLKRNIGIYLKTPSKTVFNVAERRNAIVKVEISEDRRTAYLSYTEPYGGNKLSFDETIAVIKAAKVEFGILEDKVRKILEENISVSKVRIAGAQEAVNGEDGRIEYLFNAYHKNFGPTIRDDGTADFRDLNLFENVNENTPLLRKIPATHGVDGIDVVGKSIKAVSGKDPQIPKGKNTKISDTDPNILVAAKSGSPKLQAGKVVVDDVLVVDDVDFSTGNINFNGNVVAKGIVNPGFSITAEGDITCNDTVEGADLKAGGNIFVKRGIKGLGKSRIEAGGNIIARFIERCIVEAGGSVIVDEALIHSETSAGVTVEATHAKGSIFGGTINAGSLVRASYLGSEMAITTIIEVGASPRTRKRLEILNTEIRQNKFEFESSMKNLAVLKSHRDRNPLSPEREEMFQGLLEKTAKLKDNIEKATEMIAGLQKELHTSGEGRIEARKSIFPGVILGIKDVKRRIREPIEKAIFVKEGPDIVLSTEIPSQ